MYIEFLQNRMNSKEIEKNSLKKRLFLKIDFKKRQF
jgi:hypothetical protein